MKMTHSSMGESFVNSVTALGCVSQKHRKPKLIVAPLVSMGLRCT